MNNLDSSQKPLAFLEPGVNSMKIVDFRANTILYHFLGLVLLCGPKNYILKCLVLLCGPKNCILSMFSTPVWT